MTPSTTQFQGHSEIVLKIPLPTFSVSKWEKKKRRPIIAAPWVEEDFHMDAGLKTACCLLHLTSRLRQHMYPVEQREHHYRVLPFSYKVLQCQGIHLIYRSHIIPNTVQFTSSQTRIVYNVPTRWVAGVFFAKWKWETHSLRYHSTHGKSTHQHAEGCNPYLETLISVSSTVGRGREGEGAREAAKQHRDYSSPVKRNSNLGQCLGAFSYYFPIAFLNTVTKSSLRGFFFPSGCWEDRGHSD